MLWGKTLQITWTANTEKDLSGYRIYYGTASGQYGYALNVGSTTSVTLDGFLDGETYYVALTAYDYSGNESGYSSEVSVTIPAASTGLGILDTFIGWVRSLFGAPQSADSLLADYNIKDFSSLSTSAIYQSMSVMRVGGINSSTPTTLQTAGSSEYVIKDAISMVGEYNDFSGFYPDGTYLFLPLTGETPRIENNFFTAEAPGVYLYLVADPLGEYLHILRVSAMDMLYAYSDYQYGSEMYLEDQGFGISVTLSPQAIEGDVPVAIGSNYTDITEASAQAMNGRECVAFTIAPYGLTLSEPAEIHVAYDGATAVVEYYDENDLVWKSVPDAKVENGQVVFSAQTLGKFRVYGDSASPSGSSGGGGGGCFLSTCR